MLDNTLTQLINELVRLTDSLIRAGRELEAKDAHIAELEAQLSGPQPPDN